MALTTESAPQPVRHTHTLTQQPTTTGGQDLLEFGEEDENQDFDPLMSKTSQTGPSLLGDLSSLEQPTPAPPTATPTMTPLIPSDTPLIATQTYQQQPNIPQPTTIQVMPL